MCGKASLTISAVSAARGSVLVYTTSGCTSPVRTSRSRRPRGLRAPGLGQPAATLVAADDAIDAGVSLAVAYENEPSFGHGRNLRRDQSPGSPQPGSRAERTP